MLWPVAFASSMVSSDKSEFYILGGNDEGTVLSTSQVYYTNFVRIEVKICKKNRKKTSNC